MPQKITQSPQHPHTKADKTYVFVVLDKTDYYSKLQNSLDDHNKFKNLNKNPNLNKKDWWNANNAVYDNTKLPQIIEDLKPSYLYRTINIYIYIIYIYILPYSRYGWVL